MKSNLTAILAPIFLALALSAHAQPVPLYKRLAEGSPWELTNPRASYKVQFQLAADGALQRRVDNQWQNVADATPEKVSWQSRDGHTLSVWLDASGQIQVSHSSPKHPSTFRSTK